MKKITLLILLFATFSMNAQVIISENFDTSLNWSVARLSGTSTNPGWTNVTDGTFPNCIPFSGAGMAKFASYDILAAVPANVFALTSPSFSLVGSNFYSVKFAMYRDNGYNTDADKIDVHMVTTATTVPSQSTLLGTVHRSMALSPVEAAEGWYVYQFNIPAASAGTRFLRLVATSQYGNNTYLDAVSVQQLSSNDLGMQSISVGSTIIGNAPSAITGSFRNNGFSTINSAVLNWQVDNGVVNTQNLTGLNVVSGATYNFSHSVTWSPTVGLYNLKVWVSNPNGATDNFITDNELNKPIRVASNSTTRRPLLEKFTSSTCGPCASYNTNMFTPYYTANSNNVSLINYQVNWPGAGDPYYTAETGVRRNYYQVTGAPTLFVDSRASGSVNTSGLESEINGFRAVPGYFLLSAAKDLVGSVMNVRVNTTPYLNGQFRLHVVVVEKLTTGNVATNGETSFKNVMMKMMPDANGTILNCTANTMITTNLSVNLASTFIEELSDLDVIVFVQDFNSKEIMNSGIAIQQPLSNESFDLNKIKVFPNPSNGIFTVDTDLPSEVKVLDISGKIVFSGINITNQSALNLSNLQQGVYLLKIKNDLGEQTEKIIIK